MQTTALKLYSLKFNDTGTYLIATLFVAGNIVLPQIFHLIPQGGIIFLPIYFFTLIGAFKYGPIVGLLTAVLSPLVNNLLFGMPATEVLPSILLKSVLLATISGIAANYYKKLSVLVLISVVLTYQIIGTFGEWLFSGSLYLSLQDFRMGIPGMLLQVFGGYVFVRYLIRK